MGSASSVFTKAVVSTEVTSAGVLDIIEEVGGCRSKVVETRRKLDELMLPEKDEIMSRCEKLDEETNIAPRTENPVRGLSLETPARSCEHVRSCLGRHAKNGDGMYFVLSPCFPQPQRVYCDMDSGVGYYLYNETILHTEPKSLTNLMAHCASKGLNPAVVRTNKQLLTLQSLMRLDGVLPYSESITPIAFDLGCSVGACSGTFLDLGSLGDVSGLVSRYLKPDQVNVGGGKSSVGFLGYEHGGIVDWERLPLNGFFCSTLSTPTNNIFTALLDCDDDGQSAPGLVGGLNTHFHVSCPKDCDRISRRPVYGGDGGVYADASSICRAAAHAGLDLNDFTVGFETAHLSYPSLLQNGIQSEAFGGKSRYAIRLTPTPRNCPVMDLVASTDENLKPPKQQVRGLTSGRASDEQLKAAFKKGKSLETSTQLAITHSYLPPNEQTVKSSELAGNYSTAVLRIDRDSVNVARQLSIQTLVEGRGAVKPVETTTDVLANKIDEAFPTFNAAAKRATMESAERLGLMEMMQSRAIDVEKKRLRAFGFDAWSLEGERSGGSTKSVDDLFEFPGKTRENADEDIAEDERLENGNKTIKGGWAFVPDFATQKSESGSILQHNGGANYRTLLSISEGDLFESDLALVKDRQFYDFNLDLEVCTLADKDEGLVAFRVQDRGSFYGLMFKFDSFKLWVKLVRVWHGISYPLSRAVYINGLESGEFAHLRISAKRGKIDVRAGHANTTLYPVVSIIDEFIPSGSIALGAVSNTSPLAFYNVTITPECCVKEKNTLTVSKQHTLGPRPPQCVNFLDAYDIDHRSLYEFYTQTVQSVISPVQLAGLITPHQPPSSRRVMAPPSSTFWSYARGLVGHKGALEFSATSTTKSAVKPVSAAIPWPGSAWANPQTWLSHSPLPFATPSQTSKRIDLAILRDAHRGECQRGRIRFNFMPIHCSADATIGPIVRYSSPMNFAWAALGSNGGSLMVRDGDQALAEMPRLASTGYQIKESKWHRLAVDLDDDVVTCKGRCSCKLDAETFFCSRMQYTMAILSLRRYRESLSGGCRKV